MNFEQARPDLRADTCATPARVLPAVVAWRGGDAALTWGEWRVKAGTFPLVVVVVTLDPARISLALDIARESGALAPWSIANAPLPARVALNAGQFTDAGPWGWAVHHGREQAEPGTGALGGAFVVDTLGRASVVDAGDIAALRAGGTVREAVQSYPTLIAANGKTPRELCGDGAGVDRAHRDTRLAIGTLPNGRLVIAMTRFDGLGETASRLPFGPTTPEMVTVMRALGATRALMLDGGLSAQLLVRAHAGERAREWPGLRRVPLGLVGLLR